MLCVWITVSTFIGFSLQINLALAGSRLSLSDCEDYEYKLNNDNQCRECPECPAGKEHTQHCGYEEKKGRITKPKKSCVDCPPNYYKAITSPYECEQCTSKCGKGAKMIHPCNKTHDLKCKCDKGFFTADNGDCVRCSPCCGRIPDFANKDFKKECDDAGMKMCSCRPLAGCGHEHRDCKNGFLKLSKETPSRKTTPSPTTKIATRTHKKTITTTEPKTHKNLTTDPKSSTSEKKERKDENKQSFATGWLVATVIAIILVAAFSFQVLKHFNILKKIKVLLKPREQVVEDDASHSVITVEERFESPAGAVITNYAERVLPEEEEESQSDHIQHRLAVLNRSTVSVSHLSYDEFADYDPWVYRDSIEPGAVNMRPIRWPLTRAEVALNPAYGEYIEILRSEDVADDCLSTQGNNSGSLQQLDESSISHEENESPPQAKDNKEAMKVNLDDKPGQEHSDGEEPPTSIPATACGEKTVVIATGQHRGMINDEFVRNDPSKGKQDKVSSSGKRRKKQLVKRKTRKTLDDESMESEEVLRCTCGDCSYRPYVREEELCHCTECVPQPTDDTYVIIERRCLRAEICKELNKKGVPNWRELCTYIRIDKEITCIEKEENPAEVVLDKLKTCRPRLKLEDFSVILNKIKRQDIMEMIMYHHVKCLLCRRNSFDGSLVNIHKCTISVDPSTSWIASKFSS